LCGSCVAIADPIASSNAYAVKFFALCLYWRLYGSCFHVAKWVEGAGMNWAAEELWDVDLGDAMPMQNSEFKIQKRQKRLELNPRIAIAVQCKSDALPHFCL
jgi:hypothetical protein